ncbi:MAG: hypothetical protein QNJ71_05135 [Acidimicrobiia bacterium]|nr:hypothetical protein [Acidimicrobiia bacterium]
MASDRSDQIELLREELGELDEQVAAGDLDPGTASELREKYEAELAALVETQDSDAAIDSGPGGEGTGERRISGRVLAGAAVLGLAIVVIGVLAATSFGSGTSGAEGVASDAVEAEGAPDLSQVTNEQLEEVVAANPDVVGMRLALARRYFEEGTFDRALDHYFEVLDREQHPEALANVGWMTYLSNRPDIALEYLDAALERQPDYLPAQWFKANVLVTLQRGGEAVPLLVLLADSPDVPDDVKENALRLLRQVEGQETEGPQVEGGG